MLPLLTQKKPSFVQNSIRKNYIFQSQKPTQINQGDISIKQVTTDHDFKLFINLPTSIYENDEGWVQPFWVDEKNFFKSNNHFWSHADCILFLAIQNNMYIY